MKNSAEWYQEEVVKLLAIMEQDNEEGMVSREYIKEKLSRILSEIGIGIHPTLKPYVEKKLKELGDKNV